MLFIFVLHVEKNTLYVSPAKEDSVLAVLSPYATNSSTILGNDFLPTFHIFISRSRYQKNSEIFGFNIVTLEFSILFSNKQPKLLKIILMRNLGSPLVSFP